MSTFIISVILIIVVALAIRSIIKDKKKSSCGGNCTGCSGCSDMKNDLMKAYYQEK